MSLELAIGLGLGLIIGIGRWREYQWRRSPLVQAQLVLDRGAARVRPRQRELLGWWHALEWSVLALVCLGFLAWAAAPIVAELVGAAR